MTQNFEMTFAQENSGGSPCRIDWHFGGCCPRGDGPQTDFGFKPQYERSRMKQWIYLAAAMMTMFASVMAADEASAPLTVIVMDPLSAPLACDCVKGYAQRKYEKLGEYLKSELKRPVKVVWSESLTDALEQKTKGNVDLAIGKHSVVLADAKEAKISVKPVALLTGTDGSTTQTGLFIVRKLDAAMSMKDLAGYRILFGPADCDEKSAAPMALLKKSGLPVPNPVETSPSCSDAAKELIAFPDSEKAAAVVSSYAQPLLEGCGAIKKGDVRVIGESAPVPFITAFINDKLDKKTQTALTEALLRTGTQAGLLIALETQKGFVPFTTENEEKKASEKTTALEKSDKPDGSGTPVVSGKEEWPQFRGPFRNGTVPWLPTSLPSKREFVWSVKLPSEGIGGIAVAAGCVIAGARDALDQQDFWICLDSVTGAKLWQLSYPAVGRLDYGNSPRATPLIASGHAWLQGAFGHLHCVRLNDGHVVWKMNFAVKFQMPELTWGLSSSPLLVNNLLIIQPGGSESSLVALNPMTGDVVWQSPGLPPGHASFTVADWNGNQQLIGYDKASFGGWNIETGERLWTVVPQEPGDFNVPSPIVHRSGFILMSENNGTRVYAPRSDAPTRFEFVEINRTLSPDAHSPVVSGNRLVGIDNGLHCLSLENNLKSIWKLKDRAFRNYGSLIASADRVLAITFKEELILINPQLGEPEIVSRLSLSDDGTDCWSHPALANQALFLRLGRSLCRLNFSAA